MALTTVQPVRRKRFFVLLGILFLATFSAATFVGRTMESIGAGWWRRPQPRV